MDWNDWNNRWNDREDGEPIWHERDVNQVLQKALNPRAKSVFVPLCGKSLDMIWLQQQGCHVVGVEFNEQGIREFFEENDIEFNREGNTFQSTKLDPKITIHCRDLFAEVAPTEAAQDPEGRNISGKVPRWTIVFRTPTLASIRFNTTLTPRCPIVCQGILVDINNHIIINIILLYGILISDSIPGREWDTKMPHVFNNSKLPLHYHAP